MADSQYHRPAVYGAPTGPCTVAAVLAGKPVPTGSAQPHPRPDRTIRPATLAPGAEGGAFAAVPNKSACYGGA